MPQVLPWEENRNLLEYVKKNPKANKNYLVGDVSSHMRERKSHYYGLVVWLRGWPELPPFAGHRTWER